MRRCGVRGPGLSADARRIVAAQGARALAYGLGSVLIGVTLARRGLSATAVGAVLAALLAGSAIVSVLIARHGDRIGRRRTYRLLFVAMAGAGTVFALTGWLPALILAALTGTVSTDVVESGPFTSLEQAMLPHAGADATRLFGTYNTVATLAGSLGALIALAGSSPHWLLAYPRAATAGFLATAGLSPSVEGKDLGAVPQRPLNRSRRTVFRLSSLFALDSFGGGFVSQTFVAYLFTRKYDASPHTLAVVFFAIGILQAVSFQMAVRLAGRFGLLRTMVFTHLPSNLLLAAVAFARSFVLFDTFGLDPLLALLHPPNADTAPDGTDANHDGRFNAGVERIRTAGVGGLPGLTTRQVREYFTVAGGGLRVVRGTNDISVGLRNDSLPSWLWLQAAYFEVVRRKTEQQLFELYGAGAVDLSARPWVTYLRWNTASDEAGARKINDVLGGGGFADQEQAIDSVFGATPQRLSAGDLALYYDGSTSRSALANSILVKYLVESVRGWFN